MSFFMEKDGITTEVVSVIDVNRLQQSGYKKVEEPKDPQTKTNDELDDLTVVQLKELAKANGLEGYSTLNKGELIDLLKGGE
ncbi:MAG: Rho termination factor N-terminal domain-containing protein [Chloroflexota bacterium]|nr:Rho termination factor N-terminal domain-containing protein [Chloroflexota bacterium]